MSTLRFVEERRNALFLGPPGVGVSHLAIALGIAATEAGYRTYFTTAVDLVGHLQAAHLEGAWASKMRTYTGPSVLVIDELGYLPMDATSAHWIFQVVSRRYERGSIVLTSNRGFGDWGQVFADQVVASAILDRLRHHATVFDINGQSSRMWAHVPAPGSAREGARKGARPQSRRQGRPRAGQRQGCQQLGARKNSAGRSWRSLSNAAGWPTGHGIQPQASAATSSMSWSQNEVTRLKRPSESNSPYSVPVNRIVPSGQQSRQRIWTRSLCR